MIMFKTHLWMVLSFFIIALLVCLMMTVLTGCHEHLQHEVFDTDHTADLLETLQNINAAASPLHPYALPIGAGLAGVVAMLESLRRVEKGKRKYAEHELNNNKKNHS